MTMNSNTEYQKLNKLKAIKYFSRMFNFEFIQLDPMDVDFKLTKNGEMKSYAEVGIVEELIQDAYPLHLPLRAVQKLADKRLNPILMWACNDGIIYGRIEKLLCDVKWGGVPPPFNNELVATFKKQPELKFIKYL